MESKQIWLHFNSKQIKLCFINFWSLNLVVNLVLKCFLFYPWLNNRCIIIEMPSNLATCLFCKNKKTAIMIVWVDEFWLVNLIAVILIASFYLLTQISLRWSHITTYLYISSIVQLLSFFHSMRKLIKVRIRCIQRDFTIEK